MMDWLARELNAHGADIVQMLLIGWLFARTVKKPWRNAGGPDLGSVTPRAEYHKEPPPYQGGNPF